LIDKKGGRRDADGSWDESSGAKTTTGGEGISDGISSKGIDADVPLSKRI
jgi:hypothetical protein